MAAHDSPVLNAQEAADYIGRSVDYVRRQVRYEIPVQQKKGSKRGHLRFFKTDLDRWLASNTTTPVP